MLILSWDIGIKNLAYCFLEYKDNEINIINWEIINLLGDENTITNKKIICQSKIKNGTQCLKSASFYNYKTLIPYCKIHSKNQETNSLLDINNVGCSHILKNKNLKCAKKALWFTEGELQGYCSTHYKKYLDNNLHKKNKKIKKTVDLDTISINLIKELDNRQFLQNADIILIENQPALKNPKMKSIQMLVYSYFLIRSKIDKNNNCKISFLLASNKLKVKIQDTEKNNIIIEKNNKIKDKYKRRKELAKDLCLWFLDNNILEKEKWLELYNNHKKKDDMADTFLMNIYQIQN
tara:strand:+ start:908 stop:1786 length:879 start_codon:yes stop_codon:yes gene_type:complete